MSRMYTIKQSHSLSKYYEFRIFIFIKRYVKLNYNTMKTSQNATSNVLNKTFICKKKEKKTVNNLLILTLKKI